MEMLLVNKCQCYSILTPGWENGDGPGYEMIVIVVILILIAWHDVILEVHVGGSLQLQKRFH